MDAWIDSWLGSGRLAWDEHDIRASFIHEIREVFGNPFQPSSIDPLWLAWEDGTIPKLAGAIYDERAFDRLPILGDALEEAGCADEAILSHLRSPGVHVRGCWVLELLRKKQRPKASGTA